MSRFLLYTIECRNFIEKNLFIVIKTIQSEDIYSSLLLGSSE